MLTRGKRLLLGAAALLAILAALIAWLAVRPGGSTDAKGKTIARLEVLRIALHEFHTRNQRYPTESEGLAPLTDEATGVLEADPPYSAIALDGWGRSLVYRLTGEGMPVLYSTGPNGIDEQGAGDDLKAAAGE
jgi:type II secretory pathway pseudopilin PulG